MAGTDEEGYGGFKGLTLGDPEFDPRCVHGRRKTFLYIFFVLYKCGRVGCSLHMLDGFGHNSDHDHDRG